jgi:hypothetical protein
LAKKWRHGSLLTSLPAATPIMSLLPSISNAVLGPSETVRSGLPGSAASLREESWGSRRVAVRGLLLSASAASLRAESWGSRRGAFRGLLLSASAALAPFSSFSPIASGKNRINASNLDEPRRQQTHGVGLDQENERSRKNARRGSGESFKKRQRNGDAEDKKSRVLEKIIGRARNESEKP